MPTNSIQEVIKEEACEAVKFLSSKEFENEGISGSYTNYRLEIAIERNAYIKGATKWAEMLIELNKVYADYCGTDLLKTFFEQSKQKK